MPPIEYMGKVVGHYAENGSEEWRMLVDDPKLRLMSTRTDEGKDLGFSLFVGKDGIAEPAASESLKVQGHFGINVNFIREDASINESGSYSTKVHN